MRAHTALGAMLLQPPPSLGVELIFFPSLFFFVFFLVLWLIYFLIFFFRLVFFVGAMPPRSPFSRNRADASGAMGSHVRPINLINFFSFCRLFLEVSQFVSFVSLSCFMMQVSFSF